MSTARSPSGTATAVATKRVRVDEDVQRLLGRHLLLER